MDKSQKLPFYITYESRSYQSRHITLKQRRLNVDSTSWFYRPSNLRFASRKKFRITTRAMITTIDLYVFRRKFKPHFGTKRIQTPLSVQKFKPHFRYKENSNPTFGTKRIQTPLSVQREFKPHFWYNEYSKHNVPKSWTLFAALYHTLWRGYQ